MICRPRQPIFHSAAVSFADGGFDRGSKEPSIAAATTNAISADLLIICRDSVPSKAQLGHPLVEAQESRNRPVAALLPFKVGLQLRGGVPQWALHGPKASTPSTRQVLNGCQYDSNTEDSVSELLSMFDSVSSDNVHNNVSCLHVSAPVFCPRGFDPVVTNQFNDSVFSCSSVTQGFLSRLGREGHWLMVWHPLSLEGFQCGLADCPDSELVQFMLEGIRDGVWLGSLEGTVDADPWHCKNGQAVRWREVELHAIMREEVAKGWKLGPFAFPPFAEFKCSPVSFVPKCDSMQSWLIHNLSTQQPVLNLA